MAEPLPCPYPHPRFDPARRTLPLAAWPEADRQGWEAAIAPGDVLEAGGAAAGWRPATRGNVVQGWGYYLAWLARTGQLAADEDPLARATPARLAGYVAALRARGLAPRTIHGRVEALDLFLGVAVPGGERDVLRRLLARLRPRAGEPGRRDKRQRLRPSHELFALGGRLMEEAEKVAEAEELGPQRRRHAAALYRDGLLIALLAARPLRRRNLVALELGRHLVRAGSRDGDVQGWRLVIPGAETKTGKPLDLPFPEVLVPALERYLARHRPVLATQPGRGRGRAGAALWLSVEGGPLSAVAVAQQVARRTRAAFGRSVNVHLFRDCAATSLAIEDPVHVRIAAEVLGHSSFTTTERFYNLARGQEAAISWHQTLDRLRRRGT